MHRKLDPFFIYMGVIAGTTLVSLIALSKFVGALFGAAS